jgi:hypothetical protein
VNPYFCLNKKELKLNCIQDDDDDEKFSGELAEFDLEGSTSCCKGPETSGRYANRILKDVFLVMFFPHSKLLLYVRMIELPTDVLLAVLIIDLKNERAFALATEVTPT